VVIADGHEALLRARRDKIKGWPKGKWEAYVRHRWRVEGSHGEAKTQHCLRRAVRRGTANVAIQVYLTAAVMNLKRLASVFVHILIRLGRRKGTYQQYGDGSSTKQVIYRSENTRTPARKTAA